MTGNGLVKGLVAGGLVGAALGVLYAPKSGRQTREEIRHTSEALLKKAKDRYERASRGIGKLTGKRIKAGQCGADALLEGDVLPAGEG